MPKPPSEAEVQLILTDGKLFIGENITWKEEASHYRTRVPILNPYNINLSFLAQKNVRIPNLSMVVLYDNLYRVRGFDLARHSNPAGSVFHPKVIPGKKYAGKHKHIWTDFYQDQCIYELDDVQDKDFFEAIFEFLAECNVTFTGKIDPLPNYQFTLGLGSEEDDD